MPTPTEDYQASLLGLLMGAFTVYQFGKLGISGLGVPPSKTTVLDLDGQDGEYAGPEYLSARTLLLHIEVEGEGATLWSRFKILRTAWQPTTAPVNLHLQLPNWGHIYFTGQPRGLEDDCSDAPKGRITAVCEFRATDPHAHNA